MRRRLFSFVLIVAAATGCAAGTSAAPPTKTYSIAPAAAVTDTVAAAITAETSCERLAADAAYERAAPGTGPSAWRVRVLDLLGRRYRTLRCAAAAPVSPPSSAAPTAPAPAFVAPPPTTAAPPAPVTPPTGAPAPAAAYYPNCAAARAAGVAPLHVGDPGYRAGLDRDGDGIACEV